MEEFFGSGFEGGELIDARVVDEDVELTKGFYGLGEKARDVGLLGDVALHGDGFAALGGDFFDNLVGAFLAGRIIDSRLRHLQRQGFWQFPRRCPSKRP